MNTETLATSRTGQVIIRLLGAAMESRFRYRFFNPEHILEGAGDLRGQVVLEIGCGTGFFSIPAARLIGDQGHLVAMDILQESVEFVSRKVRAAQLQNVEVLRRDALNTDLTAESFQAVLLFGVIPAPMLPLERLLREIHRVLKPEGNLAVWPPVPGWLPQAIARSGLFRLTNRKNGVYRFERC